VTPARRRWAVIPAAGQGSRFDSAAPKQYALLRDRPVLSWSLRALLAEPSLEAIVVAVAPDDRRWPALPEFADPRVRTCPGGATRDRSVAHALEALSTDADATDWVMVHDAARPCLDPGDVARLCAELEGDAVGGLLAVPMADTLKRDDGDRRALETVERAGLWRALTPQMFRYGLLRRALALCAERGRAVTDEAAAIECLGLRPSLVRGREDNIKITSPADAVLAAAILGARGAEAGSA
jgi:2-C-methyl-D-erythritol 4-phosphate cytidylyltransferase